VFNVRIDYPAILENVRRIRALVNVPIIAVVKCDAYGCGAREVIQTIDALVDSYYVFHPREVMDLRLHELTNKSFIATTSHGVEDVELLKRHRIRPAVWTVEQARRFAGCRPVLSVDTGMQRFACPAGQIDDVLRNAIFEEVFTHATRRQQAIELRDRFAGKGKIMHAAGTGLLSDPECWLDRVRPGLALYNGAVHVTSRLLEVRTSTGPAGYSSFVAPMHGVISGGYSHGLRPGPCMINGRRERVIEVGMQSSFVSVSSESRIGDEVVLLGNGVTTEQVALSWQCSPQNALVHLTRSRRNQV
jgi:alanine racemase